MYLGCAVSLLLLRLSIVVRSQGYALVVVCGLLLAMVSLVADHRL